MKLKIIIILLLIMVLSNVIVDGFEENTIELEIQTLIESFTEALNTKDIDTISMVCSEELIERTKKFFNNLIHFDFSGIKLKTYRVSSTGQIYTKFDGFYRRIQMKGIIRANRKDPGPHTFILEQTSNGLIIVDTDLYNDRSTFEKIVMFMPIIIFVVIPLYKKFKKYKENLR